MRCRWGWHSWRFIEMGPRRVLDVVGHTQYVCRLVEKCRRCGVVRTNESADVPRRVRI